MVVCVCKLAIIWSVSSFAEHGNRINFLVKRPAIHVHALCRDSYTETKFIGSIALSVPLLYGVLSSALISGLKSYGLH